MQALDCSIRQSSFTPCIVGRQNLHPQLLTFLSFRLNCHTKYTTGRLTMPPQALLRPRARQIRPLPPHAGWKPGLASPRSHRRPDRIVKRRIGEPGFNRGAFRAQAARRVSASLACLRSGASAARATARSRRSSLRAGASALLAGRDRSATARGINPGRRRTDAHGHPPPATSDRRQVRRGAGHA